MTNAPLWFIAAALWWMISLQYDSIPLMIVPCIYMGICCFMASKELIGNKR